MKELGQIIVLLILGIVGSLYGGWVLQLFWEWFIVYTFDFQPLTYIQAIGLSFFIAYYKFDYSKKADEFKETIEKFIKAILTSLSIVGIGYIITLFQ